MSGGIEIALIAAWVFGVAVNVLFLALRVRRMRREGRPIVPLAPADAVFAETRASGRWLNSTLSQLGGAHNVLLVVVRAGRLIVTPTFPFSLMPMPKAWRLNVDTPLTSITSLQVRDGAFGRDVRLELSGEPSGRLELRLRDASAFIAALRGATAPATVDAAMRKRFRLTFTKAFLIFWSCSVVLISGSLLPQAMQVRFTGQPVDGVVVGPATQRAETASALIAYTAEGRRWTIESGRGQGMWRPGQRVRLYYLPQDPEHAREDDGMWPCLLFLALGIAVLACSLFSGSMLRWFASKVDAKPAAIVR